MNKGKDDKTPFKPVSAPYTETKSATQQNKRWYQRSNNWTVAINAATLVFVGIYTIIAFYAFIANDRAFVYFDGATFEAAHTLAPPESKGRVALFNLPSSTPLIIAARFTLRNEGGTATSKARVVLDCKKLPYADRVHQEEPFSLFRWDEEGAVSEIIGPKQSIVVGPCEMSGDCSYLFYGRNPILGPSSTVAFGTRTYYSIRSRS
jgi:hypothetical protein